ncbi:MAG: divergent polysaccharide deacetylase family protein [Acidobacteria bacterium]|nr:divergent polysaccharide deacetylase family protein [Acidobacteriota bacterium]
MAPASRKKRARNSTKRSSIRKKRGKVKGRVKFPFTFTGILLVSLSIAFVLFFFLLFSNREARTEAVFFETQAKIDKLLPSLAKKAGISLALPGRRGEGGVILVRGDFPGNKRRERIVAELRKGLPSSSISLSSRFSRNPNRLIVNIVVGNRVSHRLILKERRNSPLGKRKALGKVALIIDDVGYDIVLLEDLLSSVDCPLAVSVLPHLPYSRESAELAHRLGFEVMLHLPMEPVGYPEKNPGEGAIFIDMSPEEVRWTIEDDLLTVPYAVGVNNHMGSRATEDRDLMRIVFEVLKEKRLFFVDSRTTDYSVAAREGKELGVRVGVRTIFLDKGVNSHNDDVAGNLRRLFSLAEERGKAVGIAHLSITTVQSLKDILPLLNRNGAELVFISEVVE